MDHYSLMGASAEENHSAADDALRIGASGATDLPVRQQVAMRSSDFVRIFAIDDELATGSKRKPVCLALGQRNDAIPNDGLGKIASAKSSYNVGGVEEQPHEPGINPSLRRQ